MKAAIFALILLGCSSTSVSNYAPEGTGGGDAGGTTMIVAFSTGGYLATGGNAATGGNPATGGAATGGSSACPYGEVGCLCLGGGWCSAGLRCNYHQQCEIDPGTGGAGP